MDAYVHPGTAARPILYFNFKICPGLDCPGRCEITHVTMSGRIFLKNREFE